MALGLPQGGLNIGGHRIPWEAVGAVAAVAGVLLVLRARHQAQPVASLGQAPLTAADAGFGLPLPGADVGPALANLSQQLTQLQQQGINGATTPAAPGPVAFRSGVAYLTAGGTEQQAAMAIQQQQGGQLQDIIGRLDYFDPRGPINGAYYYPLNVPGYQPGDAPRWQQLIVTN